MAASIVIQRPPPEVFAFITDPASLSRWQDVDEVTQLTPGPVAVGTRFREVHRVAGRRREEITEVTEHEAPRRFGVRVVDGPPVDGRWDLEPAGAGATRVTFTPQVRLRAPIRQVVDVATSLVFRRFHRRLKRAIEG